MPLLLSRPFFVQVVLAIVLPAAFGLFVGWMLHTDETGYLIVSIVGILGGLFAGYDHLGADQGFVRGIIGGLLFGVFILVGHSIFHDTAKATLPDPHGVLVAFTPLLGGIFGAIGGGLRARSEARRESATA